MNPHEPSRGSRYTQQTSRLHKNTQVWRAVGRRTTQSESKCSWNPANDRWFSFPLRPLRHWTVLTFRMVSLEHRQALAIQVSPGTVDGPIPSWCRGPTVDNRRRPMRT